MKRQVSVKIIVTDTWKNMMISGFRNELSKISEIITANSLVESELSHLEQLKNQINQKIYFISNLKEGDIIHYGTIDNFFYVKKGDNLIKKMNVEITLKDGVIEQISGQL
ncbi:MAG: YlqD family protein [Candidatus Aenigmatarchaeota archaeon]